VPGAQAETGSGGMVKGCAAIRGCIAYIGDSYPVINYEYAIVRMSQPSAATAAVIEGFMRWGITAGNAFKYLAAVNFQPLPGNVQTIAKKLIDKITAR
jgi:ABC-type phosphate transport system substrate-binding protein